MSTDGNRQKIKGTFFPIPFTKGTVALCYKYFFVYIDLVGLHFQESAIPVTYEELKGGF